MSGGNILNYASVTKQLLEGFGTTFSIFILTLLLSLPLGLLVSFGRMSKNIVVSTIFKIYISILRGTPLMLQLIVVYFGPYYIFGMKLSPGYRFIAVIIGFVVNYAAYFAEIYRGGIESMPLGQYEAAKVLGYTRVQTFFKIIFPQVIKRIIPSITNEVITLVKDTSLAFTIAVAEMFTIAKRISAADASITALLMAGVFYYIFNFIVAFIMDQTEKKLGYYK